MKRKRIILTALLLAALWIMPHKTSAQFFAVRADALAACTGTLHLGAEASVADRWSVEASGYWNPIRTSALSLTFGAVQLGPRYWFYESFVGHFVGVQLSYANYLVGRRTCRYDGWACGAGVSYGYAWMLSKRWNITVEGGIGIYRTKDTQRDPTVSDRDVEYIRHARRWVLAPSRLEVAVCYLF